MLYEGARPADIVPALMLREAKPELRGMRSSCLVGDARGPGARRFTTRVDLGPHGASGRVGSLDGWVGADDRWHVPADDATPRQRQPRSAPVFETMVRVPGGDVVQRVYGISLPGIGS